MSTATQFDSSSGANMLLYFAVLFFLLISLKLYGIVRKLKQDHTKMIRNITINDYKYLGNQNDRDNDQS